MEEQYRIFDGDGLWIAQLRTAAERAYSLVTETSAKFYISMKDPKCNPYILNYGNILLIENSDGLPDWVGMIDKLGYENGALVCWAFTPERFFQYRRGPQSRTLKGKAGAIFSQMVNLVNAAERTPLVIGNIDTETDQMEETLNPVALTTNLSRIVKRSGEGYRFRPVVTNGQLSIYCDWYSEMVVDAGLILWDGYNISSDHPLEQNPPVNDVLIYGTGTTWKDRPVSQQVDEESQRQYGLRQFSASQNTKSPETLQQVAKTTLRKRKQPASTFPLTALNKGDTFQKLFPGSYAVRTALVEQGFSDEGNGLLTEGLVVNTMTFDPLEGTVKLAI